VGNIRIASVVKHSDETKAASYYYATDHLGSSSVLTNNTGAYHERIEYLPYGEVWVDASTSSATDASIFEATGVGGYTIPYKFTGKELDKETGLYYFGARYYDARLSRWISTDPALQEGKYFPKPNDYDTEHDFYWYILNDTSGKLPGMGGVFNAINMDVYHYAGNNPVKLVDPDGNDIIKAVFEISITGALGFKYQKGYILEYNQNKLNMYSYRSINLTNGSAVSLGINIDYSPVETLNQYLAENKDQVISLEIGLGKVSGEISTSANGNIDYDFSFLLSPKKIESRFKFGLAFNFLCPELKSTKIEKVSDEEKMLSILNELKDKVKGNKQYENVINKAIQYLSK